MKRLLALMIFVLSLTASFGQKEVPYLSGRVNDDANVLMASTVQKLENLLEAHEDSTSNQIAVLIINSLEGEILEEYSLKVAETWQLGQKENDNGVLLLVALNDRKMRIEVGYGLEGDLTDALSNRIIRNEIAPSFRQQDYDRGIESGVLAIIAAIEGSYVSDQGEQTAISDDLSGIPWYVRLIVGVVFTLVIGTFSYFAFLTKGGAGWFLFLFLLPFYATFPIIIFGFIPAIFLFGLYFFGFLYFKLFYIRTDKGRKWYKAKASSFKSSTRSSGSSWSSGSSSSSFSGGGGSFGGGGSSGSW
ncbi:YgcG family protein [Fulvivirga sp. RKSG066]|uniref:TPM domain-containing protein n=1 Tax=Fulvivirga aurantia TaxID=2529383 RepID=UPI0012BC2FF0|nr:TPM domain-containing protein [Fulvivirga aurantia]MTI21169.1 YgcG family protein [Fulvivirga aurantia]